MFSNFLRCSSVIYSSFHTSLISKTLQTLQIIPIFASQIFRLLEELATDPTLVVISMSAEIFGQKLGRSELKMQNAECKRMTKT